MIDRAAALWSGPSARFSFVLSSWIGQLVSVACGILLPSVLVPQDYALLFQIRQIHLFGYFGFAFLIQALVLELGMLRGRGDPQRAELLGQSTLVPVIGLSMVAAALSVACYLAVADTASTATLVGVLAFSAMLPLLAVTGWANAVLLAGQHFHLLWRLVLAQAIGVSTGGLLGAIAGGYGGMLIGIGGGQLVAAGCGLRYGYRVSPGKTRTSWPTLKKLAIMGLPQSFVALIAIASRSLDRNFAYLGYGELLGGVFGVASTIALNAIAFSAGYAEAARPQINAEVGAARHLAVGQRLVEGTMFSLLLMVAAAGIASLALPLLYQILFAEYLLAYPQAVPLSVLAICAACPVSLCFHSQMYLIATKRPRLYVLPYLLCLLSAVAGNFVALQLNFGLVGIVVVGAISNSILAVCSLTLVGRHYVAMRQQCARIGRYAIAVGLGAALVFWVIRLVCKSVSPGLGASVELTLFICALMCVVVLGVGVVIYRRRQGRLLL